MTVQLKTLIRKRGTIKAAVTRFSKYIEAFDDTYSIQELEARLTRHEKLYDDFETVQTAIEELTEINANDEE